MNMFSSIELKETKKILNKYINDKKQILDINEIINILEDSTDYEAYKYNEIKHTLDYYIKSDGCINNKNLKDIMLDLEETEEKGRGVFTKANIIVSIITAFILVWASFVANNVFFLIAIFYGLIWAYLSRFVGLKKDIDSGYVWGYFLGVIGFIVVCVLPSEKKEEKEDIGNSNKYEDLERLLQLKNAGAITEAEFEVEKAKLLK